MALKENIDAFLSSATIAVYGISRSGRKFGNHVFRELKDRGYKLFPVHPEMATYEGVACLKEIGQAEEKIEAAFICLPPAETTRVVRQALDKGVRNFWLQQGAQSAEAIRLCEEHGANCVANECILMFAEPIKSFHGFHRWVWKLIGKYPEPDKSETTGIKSRITNTPET